MNKQTDSSTHPTISIGIDWADQMHAFYVIDGQRNWAGEFEQTPEAIEHWIAELKQRFPGGTFEICLEQSKGALISGLLMHDMFRIFPINPLQLASYRESQDPSGRKGDPSDAQLLAQFLDHYAHKLRLLRPDDPQTRRLQILVRDRRQVVDQRSAHSNELKSLLKQYFPLVLQLVRSRLYADFICRLLIKWPTLDKLQRVRPTTLRKFFYGSNLRGDHVNEKLQLITTAKALTDDPVILETYSLRAVRLARLLLVDAQVIAQYDAQIEAILKSHADYDFVKSLPGAALQMQSRIIAALGTDRGRFQSAIQLQTYSGIAPVSKKSGRTRIVYHRWACSKFIKQTFHEYAGLSIPQSVWATAYYQMMLSRGKTPQMAKRSLAYKWQRIIYRCWKEQRPYDESRYLACLKQKNSPILKFIKPSEKGTTCSKQP